MIILRRKLYEKNILLEKQINLVENILEEKNKKNKKDKYLKFKKENFKKLQNIVKEIFIIIYFFKKNKRFSSEELYFKKLKNYKNKIYCFIFVYFYIKFNIKNSKNFLKIISRKNEFDKRFNLKNIEKNFIDLDNLNNFIFEMIHQKR